MNLFNFLRFQNIENKAKNDEILYRLAQKKNGKFVLVDDKGKIMSDECDWISNQIEDIRLAEKNGIISYMKKDGLSLNEKALPRTSEKMMKIMFTHQQTIMV